MTLESADLIYMTCIRASLHCEDLAALCLMGAGITGAGITKITPARSILENNGFDC